ncbi:hypothetical protein AB1Y20_018792 [Prymnesium parvum]|uniref:Protein kinase domain-containing protein n=1 Tax=Prymnesium parvum TaxID=97485 RepID=A0AB34JSE6_PRYPA
MAVEVRKCIASSSRSRIFLCSDADGAPILLKATRLDPLDLPAAERLRRELHLLSLAHSEFVATSRGWLSSSAELLVLLDYLPGGDLDHLLERHGTLSAPSARFYAGCVALGLEALHSRRVAHRDVKPENVCVAADGYARLVDLGFSRELPDDERAHTLLGTPSYLAPEVFLARGHGTPCDLWALGATLYTLLVAAHPYGGETPDRIYAEALKGPPFFPKNHGFPPIFPPAAKELVEALLQQEPSRRPRAADLWAYAFFAQPLWGGARPEEQPFRREELLAKTVPPPFVPRLSSPFSTSYFEFSDDESADDESDGVEKMNVIVHQPGGGVALADEIKGDAATPSLVGGDVRIARSDFHPPSRRCESLEELLQGTRAGPNGT